MLLSSLVEDLSPPLASCFDDVLLLLDFVDVVEKDDSNIPMTKLIIYAKIHCIIFRIVCVLSRVYKYSLGCTNYSIPLPSTCSTTTNLILVSTVGCNKPKVRKETGKKFVIRVRIYYNVCFFFIGELLFYPSNRKSSFCFPQTYNSTLTHFSTYIGKMT